jgi:hypothetical protein
MRVIEVSHATYEAARQVPAQFLVASGHELTDLERVITRHGDYLIVEKIGEAALLAASLEPRSDVRHQEWEI